MQKRRSQLFIGYGLYCISFCILHFAFGVRDLLLNRVALNVGPVSVQRPSPGSDSLRKAALPCMQIAEVILNL
jgi:hypothetical protein